LSAAKEQINYWFGWFSVLQYCVRDVQTDLSAVIQIQITHITLHWNHMTPTRDDVRWFV